MVPGWGDGIKAGTKIAEIGTKATKTGYIKYGELDSLGRATGAEAYITKDMIGTGSRAKQSIKPAGYIKGTSPVYHHRGHIIAKDLGGSGTDARNLTTLYSHANTPIMRNHEQEVKKIIQNGENIYYKSSPIYKDDSLIPRGITLEAKGDNGYYKYVTILNKGRY